MEAIVVFCTIPEGKGSDLADKIINERLAGCVNIIGPIKSIYHWQGKVERDVEELLIIKTRKDLFDRLKEFIKLNHPYTVPEIVALKVENINQEYFDWLINETQKF